MFVHLHTHSDYTMLNGLMKVDKIAKKAKEYEMPAVALTDNGSMYGVFSFYSKCKGEGIKPIIGVQVYLAPRTRFDKEAKIDEKTSELVLLAKNKQGYLNLIKIVSKSHLEGFYYRPRVDKELLNEFKEGVIVLSGGENSEIYRNFLLGNNEKCKEIASGYKDIFGEDFYIEIQRTGLHTQEIVNPKLIELAKELDIQIVATNDTYYEKEEDSEAREVMWCIDGGRQMSDPARKRPESNQQYFKKPAQMEEIFADLPEAIENTLKIAEKVEFFDIGFGKVQPTFPGIPEGETEESYLRKLVFEKAEAKFGYFNQELEDRLNSELEVIHNKGYDGYFLVVWDIAKYARENGISVNARGSAAGSAIAYVLDITTVDPIKWRLFFERFLNPERPSFPDIDLDIADNRRDELIEHVKKTYGYENVSNVGALGKLTTKAALRDVGRVLGIELNIIDKLSKLVPRKFGRVLGINACISDDLAGKDLKVIEENRASVEELRAILRTEDGVTPIENLQEIRKCNECQNIFFNYSDEKCKKCGGETKVVATASAKFLKLVQFVQKIDGCMRNVSTHACGHLITPEAVDHFCPVQVESGSGKRVITQYEGKYLEDVGLMKFDFLGLANLSIIDNAVKFIKASKGIDIDIYAIPEDDAKAYDLLQRGDTTAVFQLESAGMRKYLKELKPQNLEEISAMCALYRPGPIQFIPSFINRKFGKEEVKYLIPEIEEIMKISYGLPVYQEQILQIANKIAGYSLGQADILRRAMGKKDPAVMAAEEERFVKGVMTNTKYGEDIAKQLWQYAIPFADYGFNKSHTAAYGLIAYQTAYLKANYPTEFMASLMLSDIDNQEKLVRDILDAESRGIKLLAPDVNKSDAYFRIEEEGIIRFGIGGLKGVGLKCIQSLVAERNKNGEFKSLDDLCARIDHKVVPKGAIESLIKIGAMAQFGSRAGLLQIFEDVYVRSQKLKATMSSGFIDMFASEEAVETPTTLIPSVTEIEDIQKIQWETEILGVPLTPSLLTKLMPYSKSKKFLPIFEAKEKKEDSQVRILGQVKAKKVIQTKKGDEMCFVDVVDASSKISVTVFPKLHAKVCNDFEVGDYIAVRGKTQKRNDEMQLLASDIKSYKEADMKKKFDSWMKRNASGEEEEATEEAGENQPVQEEVAHNSFPMLGIGDIEEAESTKEVTAEPTSLSQIEEVAEEAQSFTEVKIYIKVGTPTDVLRELNAKFLTYQTSDEPSVELYLVLPNHVAPRTIKMEGKYLAEIAQLAELEAIEKIDAC